MRVAACDWCVLMLALASVAREKYRLSCLRVRVFVSVLRVFCLFVCELHYVSHSVS